MSEHGDVGSAIADNPRHNAPAFVADVGHQVGEVAGRQVWSTLLVARPGWFEIRFRIPPGEAELPSFEPVRRWVDRMFADVGGVWSNGAFQSGGGGGAGRSTNWMLDVAFVPGLSPSDSLRLRHDDEEVELQLRGADARATVVAALEDSTRAGEDGCKRCNFPTLGRPDGFCARCRSTVDRVVAAYSRPFAPTRSLSLMADLGDVLGARTWMVALEGFDTWFNIQCIQSWPGSTALRHLDDSELAGRWTATDDRGGSYVGFGNGASMARDKDGACRGMTQELSFAPGLDPEAKRLRLTLPVHDAQDRLVVELAL
jgi:hypothetical protein